LEIFKGLAFVTEAALEVHGPFCEADFCDAAFAVVIVAG
jgi:hypothetical protein